MATDTASGTVGPMTAELLNLPAVSAISHLELANGRGVAHRDLEGATETVEFPLPAVLTIDEGIARMRLASLKGIMAAKKKPVETWSLGDLGVDSSQVGLDAAWTKVESFTKRPPREQGQIVTDEDGSGAKALAEFLASKKFI